MQPTDVRAGNFKTKRMITDIIILQQKCKDFGVKGFPDDLSKDCSICMELNNGVVTLPGRELDQSDLYFLNMFWFRPKPAPIVEIVYKKPE
jgi:hypothetical protein